MRMYIMSSTNTQGNFFFEPKITTLCSVIVLGVGIYCIKRYSRGASCKSDERLDGKTVLITGANSGIGAATAEDMARRGARVIMACRNMFKAERVAFNIVERTGSKQMVVQHIDLASFDSIRNFVNRIKSQESRLDILINNAGVATHPDKQTIEGLELNFGVNHVGHFLLTTLLLDMLKKSAPSRIINVSSGAYQHSGKFDFYNLGRPGHIKSTIKAYSQSKLANILFSHELGRRLAGTGVVSMSLHPGFVSTDIFRDSPFWMKILTLLLFPFSKSSSSGAQTSIHCATLQPTREMMSGKSFYYSECAQKALEPFAEVDEDAERLWEWTERFIERVQNDDA